MDGFLLVDKPAGMTSHTLGHVVRRTLGLPGGRRGHKVGHAGTLDPFATGLVVVLLGSATRVMQYVVGHDKRYGLEVALGASTSTDDTEGEPVPGAGPLPGPDAVRAAVTQLAATTEQVPPGVSALHVDGRRAYELVRSGEEVVLDARPVAWNAIDITGMDEDEYGHVRRVRLDVHCGSGAYLRALARDLGTALGCGGHASALRRTEVGAWTVADAVAPDEVMPGDVLPAAGLVAGMTTLDVGDAAAHDLAHGRAVRATGDARGTVAVTSGGTLVAIADASAAAGAVELRPRTVLVQPRTAAAGGAT